MVKTVTLSGNILRESQQALQPFLRSTDGESNRAAVFDYLLWSEDTAVCVLTHGG